MQNSWKFIYAGVSFSVKLKVVGWKETPVHLHSCEFCEIFKNNYLVVNVQPASDILGYPYVGISSAMWTLKKCTVFSRYFCIFSLQIDFRILQSLRCTTSGVYLEPYQTSTMQKRSIIDIWQGSKYVSAASFFNISYFPEFLRLDTWINIWTFCFSSENVQLLCSCDINQKCNIFYWFPNHLLYIDHGNTKFSYICTIEMRKSLLWKISRGNAKLIYTNNKNKKAIMKTRTG